jgi:superfamily II DNA or RNA helicase
MQESRTAFSAGEHVLVRDERWAIVRADSFGATRVVTLRGVDASNRDELQSVLAPVEVISGIAPTTRLRQRSHRMVLRTIAGAVAEALAWSDNWTAAGARMDLHEWQLEPAHAAVTGTMRMLLCDGVGLGKTIQAGVLVAELAARGLAERTLILTPPSIRDQWRDELRRRFQLPAVVIDQPALTEAVATLPPDVNPWSLAPVIISSIDLVKRGEVRAALDGLPVDVLVIDEAHHATSGTDRGALVADLASRTPWVVLSTATPHSGDDDEFDFLTRLGKADSGSPEMKIFRRSPCQRTSASHRSSRLLMVTPTPAERALLDAVAAYVNTLRSTRGNPAARLVGAVIARRAASSAKAVARTLGRRAALLQHGRTEAEQVALPWEESGAADDDVSNATLSVVGLSDGGQEVEWLQALAALADSASTTSSKVNVIARLLRRTKEPLLIFSEFRDVVLDIAAALANLTTVATLHGGLTPRERRGALTAFTDGGVRLLVATDAAGEGLNLHSRCRVVINVELPWMPARLEQRIGRVDRMGQRRRVHAIHLAHRGSYEGTVIARLDRRRSRAGLPFDVAVEAGSSVAVTRRLQQLAAGPRSAGVYAGRPSQSAVRQRRPAQAVHLLFAVPLLDGAGGLIQRELIWLRAGRTASRRLPRRLVRALVRCPKVREALAAETGTRVRAARAQMQSVADAIDVRLAALVARLSQRSAVQVQTSLFDRRQELAAARHATDVSALQHHLSRRRESAQRLRDVAPGQTELVAAWLDEL